MVTRRKALQGAAALVGGSLAATQMGAFMGRAAVAADEGAAPAFFDSEQFALLERIVDVMIPETDTPGAQSVGVHYFIDLMMAEWASSERQGRYVDGLQDLNTRLREAEGEEFLVTSQESQLAALRRVDQQAFEINANEASHSFYKELKRLVLYSYYSSEAGATIELQYEALTPEYKACVPIEDIGRAWFWMGFPGGL